MKRIIPFVAMAVIATSIFSCQKEHSVQPKGTISAISASKKDTTPPSFRVYKEAPVKAAAKDTTPPSK